jgi:SAM-dependent methyltransferase
MDLSYQEQHDKLSIRIRAHKEFANFDVSDWVDEHLAKRARRHIFDLGCGNGNHLGLYLHHVGAEGSVCGLDRERALVEEAKERYRGASNLKLTIGSMDDPLPFDDEAFDTCLSLFAIYNSSDPARLFQELRRIMRPGAELILVGPTRNNAKEIYEYNERLTGQAIDEITLIRTDRLQQEILPIVEDAFSHVRTELLDSCLTFPSRDEFIRYFQATMLYEEVAEKQGVSRGQMIAACGDDDTPVLSKEMLAVIATKES